ncbi:hypothetical protein AKJ51_05255, partial [candidate division MSBL1 archaeon SCGC-AAA382A20]
HITKNIRINDIKVNNLSDGSGLGISHSAENIMVSDCQFINVQHRGIRLDCADTGDYINNTIFNDILIKNSHTNSIEINDNVTNAEFNDITIEIHNIETKGISIMGDSQNIFFSNIKMNLDDAYRGLIVTSDANPDCAKFNNLKIVGNNLNNAIRLQQTTEINNLNLNVVSSGSDIYIESGADNSVITTLNEQQPVGDDFDVTDNANYTVINGLAFETSGADKPQGVYPRGTIISFTDSVDGSGDGVYMQYQSGTIKL